MESVKGLLMANKSRFRKKPSIKNGFTQIPNLLLTDPNLTNNEKMVLILLKMHQMNKRSSFPSYRLIGLEMGLSRRQSIRIVDKIVKNGYLLKEKRYGTSNIYKTNF